MSRVCTSFAQFTPYLSSQLSTPTKRSDLLTSTLDIPWPPGQITDAVTAAGNATRGTATDTLVMAGEEGGVDAEVLIAMTLGDALVGLAALEGKRKGTGDEGVMVRQSHRTAVNPS